MFESAKMSIEQQLRELAKKYANQLKDRIDKRVAEMENDDHSHFLIYQVLGVYYQEVQLIDFIRIKDDFFTNMPVHFLKKQPSYAF